MRGGFCQWHAAGSWVGAGRARKHRGDRVLFAATRRAALWQVTHLTAGNEKRVSGRLPTHVWAPAGALRRMA